MDTSDLTPLLQDEDSTYSRVENRKTRRPLISLGEIGADDSQTASSVRAAATRLLSEAPHKADIICVFVVAFDTRAGNIIEWCVPDNVDLEGIEFKAMASGSHKIACDFIYFKKDRLYGLACFENMPVESEIERRARMKSVGVLASTYTHLHHYMPFLECQVSVVLQKPGRYDKLKQFYEENRGVLPLSTDIIDIQLDGREFLSSSSSSSSPHMKITHPAGCISQFVKFFGENVFILWKYILLKKRILFFSPPPVGVVCYRVYCVSQLGNHNVIDIPEISPHPLFYVNIADIDMLEMETNYIACTTEKIFEAKPHLYDLYVDNQNLKAELPVLKDILVPSAADKDKYAKLCMREKALRLYTPEIEREEEEAIFISYFTDLNNQVFSTLLDVSYSQDKQLTSDIIRHMGLDPVGDRQFLMELVEIYGIDVILVLDNPCCPK